MPAGRPSKYKPEYAEQARKLCLLGYHDAELAQFFETTEQTINAWKKKHPAFLEALKAGKESADANVAERLYIRAMGFEQDEERQMGDSVVTISRYYPPDVTAAIFWLKNRQRGKWRDKQDIEHEGEIKSTAPTVNLVLRGHVDD